LKKTGKVFFCQWETAALFYYTVASTFYERENHFFPFYVGNIFWLKCNDAHTKKLCYILNYTFMFFAKFNI
jgi:hypothetical protein